MNPSREIQLRPQDRKEVERILSQFVPNEEVWAYGSRVDGSGHELREAFSESNLPFLMDVHDWASLPPAFWATIEAQHVVIQHGGQER